MLATWANYGVLAFLLRKAKVVVTGRTLFVNVGPFVSFFAFLQIEKLLGLRYDFDKSFVFLLSFVNVFRKRAEYCVSKQKAFSKRDDIIIRRGNKEIDCNQDEADGDKEVVESIHTVSAGHKSCKSLSN